MQSHADDANTYRVCLASNAFVAVSAMSQAMDTLLTWLYSQAQDTSLFKSAASNQPFSTCGLQTFARWSANEGQQLKKILRQNMKH